MSVALCHVATCSVFFLAPLVLCGPSSGKGKEQASTSIDEESTCAADGSCDTPKATPNQRLHPEYKSLIKQYPFQPVMTERGRYVNIILVRSPFRARYHQQLYERYKDDILFLGMCSFEDFPLPPKNPYSMKFPADEYVGLFPGFLHMFREPEKIFPKNVKLLLMSQSDFALPNPRPGWQSVPKKYDFTFSGSDQDVHNDCKGWSSYAKNWTFVLQALNVMCGEYNMTGVLVATKDKQNRTKCRIPKKCKGKILQTPFLEQDQYFDYLIQGRFAFLPQIYDASPRVTTQALMHDVPLLMNKNIMGGWKYLNEQTGEFFNDLSDFRTSLERIMQNLGHYTPREWVTKNFGDIIAGARFKQFIEDNFKHRVKLPDGTRLLLPTGA